MSKQCQVEDLSSAGTRLSKVEGLTRSLSYKVIRLVSDPGVVLQKLRKLLRIRKKKPVDDVDPMAYSLGLQAGERVRVKTREEIQATLDEEGYYDRLGFMPEMDRFIGGEYTVRNRIDRFFDERNQRLLKLRNVVILDGVHCEPPKDGSVPYSGCDRLCFLFWKEAWLERIPGADSTPPK